MKANTINEWAVQIGNKTKNYKTLAGAKKAYDKARKDVILGLEVRLIRYTDVVNCVEEIESNI